MKTMNDLIETAIRKPGGTAPGLTTGQKSDLPDAITWTCDFAKRLFPGWVMDEDNYQVIRLLTAYFGRYSEFDRAGYDLSKGIILKGPVGTGKTMLMELFIEITKRMKNQYFRFLDANCAAIADEYAEHGSAAMKKYGWASFKTHSGGYGESILKNSPVHRLFDELGIEDTRANHFGNYRNIMADIICSRYDMWRKHGMLTHITTNLSGDKIEELYGDRVRSRLREMCNFIELNGKDRRK